MNRWFTKKYIFLLHLSQNYVHLPSAGSGAYINVLDKAIKCNEKNIYIVNANTIITICCEQEQNMNNLNAGMSQ